MTARSTARIGAALALACLIGATGCSAAAPATSGSGTASAARNISEEDAMFESEALVIASDEAGLLFVDTETETPYTPGDLAQARIVGTDGEEISASDLARGNLVRVVGNGIMLESYPAQYPGISEVEVLKTGSAADADPYNELVARVRPTKDPAEPPYAALSYRTDDAVVTVALTLVSSTWQDGEDATGERPAPAVALAPDALADARIPHALEATVELDTPATAVRAVRWNESDLARAAEAAGGYTALEENQPNEEVAVSTADGAASLTIEPGWRYALTVEFADGEVTYAFTVVDPGAAA
ncbi:hypothetical protein [Collinsella sp. An307]|uniref:hypothetical protein n=1 Tax=Collinsella sp. An307 TaxID=1965630 RepID=UPI000B383CCC|nr:hypothetical protein [Collinsella sp. An307]OUO19284.1 hypothetical protein B5F89_08535 [Collinsella sp. An307]